MIFSTHDTNVLRELAKKLAEIADHPEMKTRRDMWYRHNRLDRVRPMVLIFPEGSWDELLPESVLQCESKKARQMEQSLRHRIYEQEGFDHDIVTEKNWVVHKIYYDTGWGLEPKNTYSDIANGAYRIEPVLNDYGDLKKLRYPEIRYDEKATLEEFALCQELLGDILKVELKGIDFISFHLTSLYLHWRGMERMLLDMYMEPGFIHEALEFITQGYLGMLKQWTDFGLLEINNREEYQSTGGTSYTTELPKPGFTPNSVRLCDMWGSAESQEFATVGPELHEQFAWDYEKRLLAPFGLTGYGCCEDLTAKLHLPLSLQSMRRISISPFADVEKCAEILKRQAIYSWKPNPVYIASHFDENKIREYVRHALDTTRDCVIEIILKDTHTCENHPERFRKWSEIVMELVQEYK